MSAVQKATLYRAHDDVDEAVFVTERIQTHVKVGGTLRDCAVMYRTNAQSRALETELTRHNIPYQLIGGVSFYRRQEVRDILAYLRFLDNPRDTVSFERIINTPRRGIGNKTLSAFHVWTVKFGLNYGEALDLLREQENSPPKVKSSVPDETTAIQIHLAQFTPAGKKSLLSFAHLVDKWRELTQTASVAQLFRQIVDDIDYWDYLAKISETEAQRQERQENIEELERYLFDSPELSLSEFLTETTLVSDADAIDDRKDIATLQTLHTAKGLEYPVVFIVGLEEGILPHQLSLMERGGEQEERRLFYVGITRSMHQLFLSFSRFRGLIRGFRLQVHSRFLEELPQELLVNDRGEPLSSPSSGTKALPGSSSDQNPSVTSFRNPNKHKRQKIKNPDDKKKLQPTYSVGARIRHPRFGTGEVIEIEALGTLDQVLTIHFDDRNFGEKRLIASRAKLVLLP